MPFSTLLYATLLYPTLRYLFLPYATLLYPRTHTVHVVDTHSSHVYTGLNKEPSSHSPAAYMYLIQYNMYMYTYMLTHSTLETSHSVHLLLLSHSKNSDPSTPPITIFGTLLSALSTCTMYSIQPLSPVGYCSRPMYNGMFVRLNWPVNYWSWQRG